MQKPIKEGTISEKSMSILIEPVPVEVPNTSLSNREIGVIALVAQGLSNKEIGQKIGISMQTIKNHLVSIFAKLGALDRASAVVIAICKGYLDLKYVFTTSVSNIKYEATVTTKLKSILVPISEDE